MSRFQDNITNEEFEMLLQKALEEYVEKSDVKLNEEEMEEYEFSERHKKNMEELFEKVRKGEVYENRKWHKRKNRKSKK